MQFLGSPLGLSDIEGRQLNVNFVTTFCFRPDFLLGHRPPVKGGIGAKSYKIASHLSAVTKFM